MEVVNNGFKSKDIMIQEWREYWDNEEEFFKDYVGLTESQLKEFKLMLQELDELSKIKAKNKVERGELSAKKGKALENTVKYLLNSTGVLKLYDNVGTATNEIDILITSNYKGERIQSIIEETPLLLGFEDYMIIECKNYGKKVPATWIGKFYTLLQTCGECKTGIMFSYHGLTGNPRSWTDAHGLIKILNLLSRKKCQIVEFNKNDLKRIAAGESFFGLLKTKQLELKVGADLSKYNVEHRNTNDLKALYDKVIN